MTNNDVQIKSDQEEITFSDINFFNKIPKKYSVPGGLLILGYLLGGSLVATGYIAGTLTVGGYWILLNKAREHKPAVYNWILKRHFLCDIVVSGFAIIACGLTPTGLVTAAVINLGSSMMFDWIRDNDGYVENVKELTTKSIIKDSIISLKQSITSLKNETKQEGVTYVAPTKEERIAQ